MVIRMIADVSMLFLSTPSARRATATHLCTQILALYFYPRPPRGERLFHVFILLPSVLISIHALREESDGCTLMCEPGKNTISIHALREESDFVPCRLLWEHWEFLSTPSARRATISGLLSNLANADFYPRPPRGERLRPIFARKFSHFISIHALREESDRKVEVTQELVAEFLSTPSARRATNQRILTAVLAEISIHALREESDR